MYELLTYRRAYPRPGIDVLQDIASTDPTPPRKVINQVPRQLEAICLKAMQRDPRERFGSAADMADALHCWISPRKSARKGRPFVLAITTVVTAAVVIAAVGVGLVVRSNKNAATPATKQITAQSAVGDGSIGQDKQATLPIDTPTNHTPPVESPVIYLELTLDGQVAHMCPAAAVQVIGKFFDVRGSRYGDELALVTTLDQAVSHKVIGSVSAHFPEGIPKDDRFGLCEAAVSFELYKRASRAAGFAWIPVQDEMYQASSSYHILPRCGAINNKLRALSNDLINRVLARIELDRQTR